MRRLLIALAAYTAFVVPGVAVADEPVKFALSTPTDLSRNGVYVWVDAFRKAFERTGREIRIYPNGSLGGDQERVDQMRLGLLEMNVTNPDEISRHSPTYYGIAMPFLFQSYDHMDRFLEQTPFVPQVNSELSAAGQDFRFVDIAYTGAMVGLLTRKVPVRTVDDLKKIRLRFLSAPDLKLFAAWGVRGVQVSWGEVAQGLQTGMIDGYLNPPAVATMFGHGSVLDYFTDLRMGPSGRMIVVSTRWLESLTPEERAVFDSAVLEARTANRTWNRHYIAKERDALARVGIDWVEPSGSERQTWKDRTVNFYDQKWYDPAKTEQVGRWIKDTAEGPNDSH
ncbi:TRAP transporter substrate-binding protein [Pseudokordiimonas caeni]|uniref:TRAP transporter substrate-binding protein n=1 Tax=Pseudokordiimonas caeni TaxID=2997908 RepID=UPI00281250D5|nr:TRAP transporter substrate-binding protein DctP [Pseudokordiimonas caeni]